MRSDSRSTRIRQFLVFALVFASSVPYASSLGATATDQSQDIISFLNQTITWYRQAETQQQWAKDAGDLLSLNNSRQVADQVVRQAFEFASAQAKLLAAQSSASANVENSATPPRYQRLANAAGTADEKLKRSQQELESLKRQLEQTPNASKRRTLESAVAETQSEIDLLQTRRDVLRDMLGFVTGTGKGSGLESEIQELARTIPAAMEPQRAAGQSGPIAAPVAITAAGYRKEEPSGIFALATDLMALRRKMQALDDSLRLTNELAEASKSRRNPILANLKDLMARSDALANQPESQDPAVLTQQKQQLDRFTAGYKQLSATVLPLSKQSILLDVYKGSVSNWRASLQAQYATERKALILRLAALGLMLGVIIAISELWRRATIRYIQDVRRRFQFLLLRRIVVWFLAGVVVAVAFASELGSLATFAGLLTAGIAVALQNVIVAVAGYFFLIGKYGVREGDRVQIAGVTGDVVDIGLVRMHLMEVGGDGLGARPTGRVVAFSNAVVFQANAGLFKQIPGTSFVWHEIKFTLPPDGDYRPIEQRVMVVVKRVFNDYRDNMERQRRSMQRALPPIPVREMGPECRLRLTATGAELVVRYPVELENASEIDDRITREVLDIADDEPRLRLIASAAADTGFQQ